jgi:outer membrane protein assembly factor BamB
MPNLTDSKTTIHSALIICCLTVWLSVSSASVKAQTNWDRFHGPNGSGLSETDVLPSDWSDDDYLWKTKLAGSGSCSPVIWEGKLFITSCDPESGKLILQCLDANSSKQIWQTEFDSTPYRMHSRNSFASSTPAVDENNVYVTYASPDHTMLVAVDHGGEKVWERDFGSWISQHGFSASPMIYQDKVIFFNSQQADRVGPGQAPGNSRVIAVSCSDGSDVWETPLKATRSCYAVPSVYSSEDGVDQLISCNTGDGFFSLDPATGKRNWSAKPFQMRTVASMLIVDGMAIGSNGSGRGAGNYLVAMRLDKKSTTSQPTEIYTLRKANYVPSPVAINGMLFLVNDQGIGTCVDLQTGTQHWQQRISSGFSGSLVATNDHLYVMDESGNLFVIAASKEFKIVSEHDLGESTRATPAIWANKLYLRTDSHLLCIGKK